MLLLLLLLAYATSGQDSSPEKLTCETRGCPINECQTGIPLAHSMRVCQARRTSPDTAPLFTSKTISCKFASIYAAGERTTSGGVTVVTVCPGTDGLDCRCKPEKSDTSESAATTTDAPAVQPIALPTDPTEDGETAEDPCARGGWRCPTVTTKDGASIDLSHRETTTISVAVIDPKTEAVIVPSVCTSMDCSLRICAAALWFGLDNPNQTLTVRLGPSPKCGLGSADTVASLSNMPAPSNGTCDPAWYTAPPSEGPNGWWRSIWGENEGELSDSSTNTVEVCTITTPRIIQKESKLVTFSPPGILHFNVFAEIRTPLLIQDGVKELCPSCSDGNTCCDVPSHRTRLPVTVEISRVGSSETSVGMPTTSLSMNTTVLDFTADPSGSICVTFATIVNAPAVFHDDPDMTISLSQGIAWPWQFETTSLGPCTEGGPGRTCQMWMLCSSFEPREVKTCVDAALSYGVGSGNVQATRVDVNLRICLPLAVVSNTTNDEVALDDVIISIMPSVRLRALVGLACADEFDGSTKVIAGSPMCFEVCVQGYPEKWPQYSDMQLITTGVNIRHTNPSTKDIVRTSVYTANPMPPEAQGTMTGHRVPVNRGYRDARENIWVGAPEAPVDGKPVTPPRVGPVLGRHCERWTQFIDIEDVDPKTGRLRLEHTYVLRMTGMSAVSVPVTAAPEPTEATASTEEQAAIPDKSEEQSAIPDKSEQPAVRRALSHHHGHPSNDDDNHSSHNNDDDDDDHHSGPSHHFIHGHGEQEFVVTCPHGFIVQRGRCPDADDFGDNGFCRNGHRVPCTCEPFGGRSSPGLVTAIVIGFMILFVCCICTCWLWADWDNWLGTKRPAVDTSKAVKEPAKPRAV